MELNRGDLLRMQIYGGEGILVAVSWDAYHVNVCTPSEYDAAQEQGREPRLVGFKREFILEQLRRETTK